MNNEFLTPQDVADRLGVHRDTVYEWLRSGKLQGVALSRRSGYRIQPRDVDAFLRERTGRPVRAFERAAKAA
ncbi:MAG: hypothetical protein AVDCRST_MAG73-741 [uncultured Thermomicrobiales bacterium]|uniref:Helix-turn-helix domain-containing protein n=1 Tax=uncultured Thermomicrobiales bacterium TaxID=1645740 RepID=A0A6J4TPF5_9BACT|nr:MAG: hypothetical protein AVDCRST_MAG73-741 [uncultured Thermomicrobiales bacterium]